MPAFKTKEEIYDRCVVDGILNPQDETDIDKIKSSMRIAEEDLASGKDLLVKKRWNSAYKLHYDVLHALVESFLGFDNVKSSNHQCLFACLCVKHTDLEFSWDFFEKLRTKRNGINYYGTPVDENDWKEIALQANLYISALKKEIEKRLREEH